MHSTFAKTAEVTKRRASRSAAETGRPVARTATSSFLPIVQAKLRIGAPNDHYEREADRIADQVLRMPDPQTAMIDSVHGQETVQRACAACASGGGLCPECQEELRRQPNEGAPQSKSAPGQLSPPLETNIRSLLAGGQPLTDSQRGFFEPRFGSDFSAVRIHTDSNPGVDAITRSLNARAFTIGSDIVFGHAEHNPASSPDLALLAHELTHVVQQGFAKPTPEDWSEKEKSWEPQTAAPDGRFPASQMAAAFMNEPTAGFRTQDQPEVMAIARPMQQSEAPVIQRQNGGVESSVEQQCESGFGKNKVGDIYKLYATTPAQPVELSFAMIGRRTDPVVYSRFYYVGDWLADEWEIVEITNTHIIVINATCGTEETLPLEAGEPRPQAIVAVAKSNFGPGIVSIYDNCKRVEFVSDDKSQPTRVYVLETWRKEGAPPLTVYLLKGGDGTPYPPPDLERMLKVHLIGEKCGTPMSQQAPPSEEQVE
jgi:Domain of unknown function (DUF4157)